MKTIVQWVLILTAMLAGAGCTQIVRVPVSSCPAPPPIQMPYLLVDNLPPTATTRDKLQALKVDYGVLKHAHAECIAIVDGYKKVEPKVEPKN